MPTDVEVLDAAAEKIAGGWCQGKYYTYNHVTQDKYCVAGALVEGIMPGYWKTRDTAFDLGFNKTSQYDRIAEALGKHWGVEAVSTFNDARSTTQEDVLLGIKHVREEFAKEASDAQ